MAASPPDRDLAVNGSLAGSNFRSKHTGTAHFDHCRLIVFPVNFQIFQLRLTFELEPLTFQNVVESKDSKSIVPAAERFQGYCCSGGRIHVLQQLFTNKQNCINFWRIASYSTWKIFIQPLIDAHYLYTATACFCLVAQPRPTVSRPRRCCLRTRTKPGWSLSKVWRKGICI